MKRNLLISLLSILLSVACYGQPGVAAPTPTASASNVISIFSDAYTSLSGTNFNPGWGQATVQSVVTIAGNNTMKYAGLNYQGIALSGNQNVTTMGFLHLDYWTDNSTALNVYVISPGPVEKAYSLTVPTTGWTSIDIPLSAFSPVDLANVFQFKFDGNGTIYLDNIYFYKEAVDPAKDATLSDLKVDGTTVSGFSSSIISYNVELPIGTAVVPSVTATSSVAGAGVVVTPAAGLPGTSTVVVTSTDATATKTYSVNFTVKVPAVDLPVDFENTTAGFYGLTDFGGNTSSIVADPVNASNQVAKSIKSASAETWAGTTVGGVGGTTGFASKIPFTAGSSKMCVKIYSSSPIGTPVRLKVEDSTNPTRSVETEALTTAVNTWETLVFDFTVATTPPTAAINYTFNYNKASIFFNFGTTGAVAGEQTYYWDDMKFGDGTISHDATLSDLKVSGTTVAGFSASTLIYNVELPAGTTVVPTVTATKNNAGATVLITPAASLPGTSTVLVTAEDGTSTKTYSVVFTVLLTANDATLSDLKVDGTTVLGFSASTLTYNVLLPIGTTVVPTITATSTVAGAGVVITPAASLPGTTTVEVTATDGITKKTYSVAFTVAGAAAPSVAAATPTAAAIDVISIFSDAYTNLPGTNYDPDWGQATDLTQVTIAGVNTLKLANLNYQGINLGSASGTPQDISSMKNLHLDFWTADATGPFWVQLISKSSGASVPYKCTVTKDSWVSVDIPLSFYTTIGLTDIFQLEFQVESVPVSDGTFYLENIYFWTTPVATVSDATLSDLKVDGSTVSGFLPLIQSYNILLPYGTSVVPTVTATCTQAGANAVVTPAASLPGTSTVVVTAQDGTTTKTYSVIFTIAAAVPTVAASAPTVAASDVISILSDAYTNLAGTNFNPNWGQQTVTTQITIAGTSTLKLAGLNYQGINLGSEGGTDQNLSTMNNLHLDFWTSDATAFQVFLISRGSGEKFYSCTITNNTWVAVDIPLTTYTSQGLSITDIYQFKFVGNGTLYLENIYFYKTGTNIDNPNSDSYNANIYPNPAKNELYIKSNSTVSKVSIFNVIGALVKEYGNVNRLDISDLKAGVYIVRLTDTKGKSVSSKFIKK
jgi:hypothetical protein